MKIGVLVSRFPYPLEKGDKLRIYHQIKALSKKHEIYLCAISEREVVQNELHQLQKYCTSIKVIRINKLNIFFNLIKGLLFTKLPLQVAYFFKKNAKADVISFFKSNKIDHLFCQLIRVSEYVKDWNEVPKTLDYMDVLSIGMERRVSKANILKRPFIKIEADRLKKYEHFIFSSFQNRSIISEQDRDLIVHAKNDTIEIIRNGVDEDFFKPRVREKKFDLIFTGNMSYAPNVDGVCYLVNFILPEIWKTNPEITLAIVGATPNQKVQKLAKKNVIVTGWVDDIREYYATSEIFIAPMQIGTGLQNKLLEAMSMNIPCITSSLANNALNATHNQNILIADTVIEYIDAINKLKNDSDFANKIANSGKRFVKTNYDWNASTAQLENLFLKTWKS